ncbi:MAG: glycosyltransferase family 9 protein [Mariprofundaceae bacterium]
MKILIVKLSAFGDIIHTLPALDDLINRPEADEIHWLVDSRFAFVAAILPENITVHQIQTRGSGRIASIWHTIRHLRALKFDIAFDMQGLLKSGIIARLSCPESYGIDARFSPEYGNAKLVKPVCFHPLEKHVVQQYRRIATAISRKNIAHVPDEPIPYNAPVVAVTTGMQQHGLQLCREMNLQPQNYLLLHLGGSWETKRLSEQVWLDTAKGLISLGITPIFSWGNMQEHALAEQLSNQLPTAICLTEKLDIEALSGLIIFARGIIGSDTGVIHLAAALGKPTVSFWGPSDSQRSGPLSEQHQHIESHPDCGPCFKRTCNHFVCMGKITPEMLLTRFKKEPN